jgi:hypothetical protein
MQVHVLVYVLRDACSVGWALMDDRDILQRNQPLAPGTYQGLRSAYSAACVRLARWSLPRTLLT